LVTIAVLACWLAASAGTAQAQGGANGSPPASPGGQAVYPYPSAGVALGQGWDSIRERGTAASCVTFASANLPQSSYQASVEQVQSTYSLATKVTTSVSASYNGFGASASGSLSTSSESTVSSDDQNFLFTFQSESGSTYTIPPGLGSAPAPNAGATRIVLTADAANLLAKDPIAFRLVCGDGFVSTIHSGVRLFFILTQKYASQQNQDSLSATLAASGWGASANASYSTSTSKMTSTDALSYKVIQQGGTPMTLSAIGPTTPGAPFFDVNKILPTKDNLSTNPVAYQIVITPYTTIDKSLQAADSPTSLLAFGDYYLVLNDLWVLIGDIMSDDYLGKNAAKTPPYEERMINAYLGFPALESLRDQIRADLMILEAAISACYDSPSNCSVANAAKAVVANKQALMVKFCGAQAVAALVAHPLANVNPPAPGNVNPPAPPPAGAACTGSDHLDSHIQSFAAAPDANSDFFRHFYKYLAAIPLPRTAYADANTAYPNLAAQSVPAANIQATLQNAQTELVRAVWGVRLMPWLNFFCSQQKHAPNCASTEELHNLVDDVIPALPADYLSAAPPPPAHVPFRGCMPARIPGRGVIRQCP
jgi:hypothetical protein